VGDPGVATATTLLRKGAAAVRLIGVLIVVVDECAAARLGPPRPRINVAFGKLATRGAGEQWRVSATVVSANADTDTRTSTNRGLSGTAFIGETAKTARSEQRKT
jgi:hypothetical protein